jgi:hypothetical protein
MAEDSPGGGIALEGVGGEEGAGGLRAQSCIQYEDGSPSKPLKMWCLPWSVRAPKMPTKRLIPIPANGLSSELFQELAAPAAEKVPLGGLRLMTEGRLLPESASI